MWVRQAQVETEAARSRRFSLFSRFRRDLRGATAVEFALIALPFFSIIMAILELGLVMLQGALLEVGVEMAARKIYTGEVQSDAGNSKLTPVEMRQKIKDDICDEVLNLISCADLAIDVRPLLSFEQAPPDPVTPQKTFNKNFGTYVEVPPRTIGLVTAAVEYKTLFPPFAGKRLANGNRVIMSTSAFRTEPYVK